MLCAQDFRIRFESVRVPASCLIGQPGRACRALSQIGDTRLAIAAEAVGRARWTVDHLGQELLQRAGERAARDGGPVAGHIAGARLRYGELRMRIMPRVARCIAPRAGPSRPRVTAATVSTESSPPSTSPPRPSVRQVRNGTEIH